MSFHKSWTWSRNEIGSQAAAKVNQPAAGSQKKGLMKKLAALSRMMTCTSCSTIETADKEGTSPAFTIRAWAGTEPIPPTEASFDAWAAPSPAAAADGRAVGEGGDLAACECGAAGEGVGAALCPEAEAGVLDGHAGGDEACSSRDAQGEDVKTVQGEDVETVTADAPGPIVLSKPRGYKLQSPWVRAKKYDDRTVDKLVRRLKKQVRKTTHARAPGSGVGAVPPAERPSADSSPKTTSAPTAESPLPSATPDEGTPTVLRLLRPVLSFYRGIWVLGPLFLGPAKAGPPPRGLRAVLGLCPTLFYVLATWAVFCSISMRRAILSLSGDLPGEFLCCGALGGIAVIFCLSLLLLSAVIEVAIDMVLYPLGFVIGMLRVCQRWGEALFA